MTVWHEVRSELRDAEKLSVKQLSRRTGLGREKVSRVLNNRLSRGVVDRHTEQVSKRRIYFYELAEQQ